MTNERVNEILGKAYEECFRIEPLSDLTIETIKRLNILQDNLDRSLKRATEKTLNMVIGEGEAMPNLKVSNKNILHSALEAIASQDYSKLVDWVLTHEPRTGQSLQDMSSVMALVARKALYNTDKDKPV